MDRRRIANRPASSEEIECWTHTCASLSALGNLAANSAIPDTIGRVNRLISGLPSDDALPGENVATIKETHKRLNAALAEVKTLSERDVKSIDEALEHLSILIGLRRASESVPLDSNKRAKRPRGNSPAGRGNTPSTPRGSVGPQGPSPFSREPKSRREALNSQLPLLPDRMVAFHPPSAGKPNGTDTADGEDTTWILAKVVKCINQDKNRYEVQDIEPQDDGNPGACYKTTLRSLIPLPDPEAVSTSSTHLNAYHEFPIRATVLALYPDTSCFYRAEVLANPTVTTRNAAGKVGPTYKLKFDDDDDQEHTVSAQFVVEWPDS